jgi:hypothetical protein
MRKGLKGIIALALAAAGSWAFFPQSSRADIYDDLAKGHPTSLLGIQSQRGKLFHDIPLRGVMKNGESYDLRQESFQKSLSGFKEGGAVWNFINQEGIEKVGVNKDEYGSYFLNKVIVTQDSVETNTLQIKDDPLAEYLDKVALGVDSPKSIVYDLQLKQADGNIKIPGRRWKIVMDRLGDTSRKGFDTGDFPSDEEIGILNEITGLEESLEDFKTHDENGETAETAFKNPRKVIDVKYSVRNSGAVNDPNASMEYKFGISSNEGRTHSKNYSVIVMGMPSNEFDFMDNEDRNAIGLERIGKEQAKGDSILTKTTEGKGDADGDGHSDSDEKNAGTYHTSESSHPESGKTLEKASTWYVLGGAGFVRDRKSPQVSLGVRKDFGNFHIDAYTGVGKYGTESLDENPVSENGWVYPSTRNRNANRLFLAAGIGRKFRQLKNTTLSTGGFIGKSNSRDTGFSTPTFYRDGEVRKVNAAQGLDDEVSKGYSGFFISAEKSDLIVRGILGKGISGKEYGITLGTTFEWPAWLGGKK